ncbi:TetR/AcrR family transcriptional regulator [Nonomuraea jiangxiensis]|uniref:TetR/AcrR family transcriptional regulator, transcriptional repressor for nem operon n=1 Tax=Nonomuraea jiangxiensis TaxID=633440 RepID=A0A1G9B2A5_9ACTN|nr:TetR/AcrR family transcriptional regulator [Nonomuraea jiangxiensis]SDK33662.1 TetR/AcrR family transcriptional regulator, transcriptional repressor for nem operon [Nonomuraea jiangxiensis]
MPKPSKREDLLASALEVFHTRGFHGTGIKEIADAAGAPKGSFYNHFASKEECAVAALRRYGAEQRFDLLTDTSLPPLERIRRHFEFLRDGIAGRDFTRGCLVGNFATDVVDHSELIRSAVADGLGSWYELIAGALTEARRDGAVRADLDPQATAHFVVNAWEGTIIEARATRSAAPFDTFFQLIFDVVLR